MAQGQRADYVILEKQMEATAKMRTASAAMIEALRAQRECNGLMEELAREARRNGRHALAVALDYTEIGRE